MLQRSYKHRFQKAPVARLHSAGLTLIELMISITIGILLISVAIGLVVTSADARSIVKHTSVLQEEAFFVSHIVKQQLAQAGYRSILPGNPSVRSIPVATRGSAFSDLPPDWARGQIIRTESNALFFRFDGASNAAGTADESVYDCLGNAIVQGDIKISSFSIQGDQLICTVGADSTVLIGGGRSTRVEQMSIDLGVDDNNDSVIDRIIDSADATDDDFIRTRHVTLRMLLASRDGIVKGNQTYRFNGTVTNATDHRLRTEVTVSAAIRN